MKIRLLAFNTYLLAAALLLGCKTPQEKREAAESKKQKKELSTIRFHLEAEGDSSGRAEPVPILRAAPVLVNVIKDSFLDERDVLKATLVDADGGFSIRVQLDDHGGFVLDTVTTSNKGKRLAIMTEATDRRWLAAPVITRRITDGVITFTPDATREESLRIVRGLNNTSLKIRKKGIISGL
ncbi:MAG: hypothetical protein ABIQ35_09670 [Verrucomicrobiota bacterium]